MNVVETLVPVTIPREQTRLPSNGLSVPGEQEEEGNESPELIPLVVGEEISYEWDAAMMLAMVDVAGTVWECWWMSCRDRSRSNQFMSMADRTSTVHH